MAKEQEKPNTPAPVPEPEPEQTPEDRLKSLEDVVFELIDKVEEVTKSIESLKKTAVTKPKGKFGGKRTRTPMKDLKTGDLYISKAAVGKKYAAEVGKDPLDTFAWYTVEKQLRMEDLSARFVEAGEEDAAKVIAQHDAQVAKEVAEANARLEKERADEAKAGK